MLRFPPFPRSRAGVGQRFMRQAPRGALGAYQAGVYQALDEAGVRPTWIAGISIGAINAAIIAGNPPEHGPSTLIGLARRGPRRTLGFKALPPTRPEPLSLGSSESTA